MNLMRSLTVKVAGYPLIHSVDKPEDFLKLTKRCKEQAQKLTISPKMTRKMINPEQCKHLADKLTLAADSAQSFLRVFMSSESHSEGDREDCLIVFKVLYALAIVVESFIRACSQDAWIQAAMLMTNVLEHTLAVSFDLEVLTRLFTGKLELTKVDLIFKAESANVKAKAEKDKEMLILGVNELLRTSERTTREYQLAAVVLERLLNPRQNQANTSSLSGSYQISLENLKQMEQIGKGASAYVHRALWLGIEVAKKTPQHSDPAFLQEISILGGLSHPNITSLIGYAKDKEESCMVMELMEGDLYDLIRRRMKERPHNPGPFNMWESVDIMHQICRGMQYLHDVRIVHRDLKSKNILVKYVKGREADVKIEYILVKVTDFGLSKMKEHSISFGDITNFNTGTTRWMAPELIKIRDHGQDVQKESKNPPVTLKYPFLSDVHSYAMVCYEVLSGQEPYFDINPGVIREKILEGDRPKLPDRCPPQLKNLLERCWNEDASKRPPFIEICAELQYLKCWLLERVAHRIFRKRSSSHSAVTTGSKFKEAEPQLLQYDTSKEEAPEQIKPTLNRSITDRVSDKPDGSRPKQWVISLDFGTTYSGFAWTKVSTADQPTKIHVLNDWPRKGNETPYCKTLTASYYIPVGPGQLDFSSWGYPAQTDFVSHKGNPHGVRERPCLISNFKLLLSQEYVNNPEKLSISIPAPLTMTAIITEYLKQVGNHALSVVRNHHDGGSEFRKELVQWCVTVPSIWDENAKQQMKACMMNTGLVSGAATGGNDAVKVVLEAEAASFHCIQNLRQERKDVLLNVKDKVLVADVGGGIVDIVVQELGETVDHVYQVKELTESSGGLCGGTFVDESFMRFISKKIECLEEFLRKDIPSYRMSLLQDWEHHKRSFGHEYLANTNLAITLHPKLASKWEEYERNRRGVRPRENYAEIELSQQDMRSIFDPVVDEVLELMAAQLTQVPDVKVIYVVGGFAGSPYLIGRIRARFTGVQHIVCPPNPGAAVCQGAVLLARMPSVVVSRIAKKTYGTSVVLRFDRNLDPPKLKKVGSDGVEWCRHRFQTLVRKGSRVKFNEIVTKDYVPNNVGQTHMKFDLYSTTEQDPRYTEGATVTKEGEFWVTLPKNYSIDKRPVIRFTLCFGRCSIEISAKVLFMNEQKRASETMETRELPIEYVHI